MNYIVNEVANFNGHDLLLDPLSIRYSNHREISITGVITDEMATYVNAAIRELANKSDEDIILYINSPGGSIPAGFSIYNTFKAATKCDIVTVASGMAASMAAFLLSAGTKGKRYCQPNAIVMIHQPLGGISGQATDIRIHADHIENMRGELNKLLVDFTGQSLKKIKKDTDRDNFMNAVGALEYGLVDKIGDPISSN